MIKNKVDFKDKKTQLYLFVGYLIFLAAFFSYAYTIVNENKLKVTEESNDESELEVKPSKVEIKVFTDISNTNYVYSNPRMFNSDTVENLIEHLRKEEGYSYEVVQYNYGPKITEFNGIKLPEGYTWNIFIKVPYVELENYIEDMQPSQGELDLLRSATEKFVNITYYGKPIGLVNNSIIEIRVVEDPYFKTQ
jgi:hypothetical protein